ncbi:MAG: PepSY domain protein [Verrucomicrobiales bacterium]|nr:PepSY domain protein [Verrucomicrobiales bacterium]
MKLKTLVSALAAFILIGGLSAPCSRAADSSKPAASEAKITKKEASKIALAKVPGGKIKESELEKENGKLIWSFDIKTKGTKDITEVQVDAITGAVVSVEKETAAAEKKEKADEKAEKSEKK